MKNNAKQKLKDFWEYWGDRNGRVCFNCYSPATERAHIIGQGKASRGRYGNEVIDSHLDWLPSCHGCNDLIDIGRNIKADRLATIILSHATEVAKRLEIEAMVRLNIIRKRSKNGRG